MSAPRTPLSAGGSLTRKSKKDDVEALLSDFDNLEPAANSRSVGSTPSAQSTHFGSPATGAGDEQQARKGAQNDDALSLLNDLDDLVKQRRATTPKKVLTGNSLTASSPSSSSFAAAQDARLARRPPSATSSAAAAAPAAAPGVRSTTSTRTGGDGSASVPRDAMSVDGVSSIALAAAAPISDARQTTDTASKPSETAANASWGSWWNSATKLADQARVELEKRAAQVQSQVAETGAAALSAAAAAGKRGEGEQDDGSEATAGALANKPWLLAQNVNAFLKSHGGDLNKIRSDIGKVGMKRWNEILNVVVPPIESHEVLSITLSHDMLGFEGVPDVVFQILQRVMETHASSQNAEQQIVVNKAPDQATETSGGRVSSDVAQATQPGSDDAAADDNQAPDMRPVVGFSEAWRLAESKLESLIAQHQARDDERQALEAQKSPESITLPITKCPLFIRIQPVLDNLPGLGSGPVVDAQSASHLFIALVLRDPKNGLRHRTVSQPLPRQYASLSFEDNPWAEDLLSESLQGALGNVGLEYVRSRMQAQSEALTQAAADASLASSHVQAATPDIL